MNPEPAVQSATRQPEEPTSTTVALNIIGRSTSRVGFGTGSLLRTGSPRGRQRLLAAALDSGITHFDTAPVYGFGESERTLGRFLVGRRQQVTVTTKFGLQASPMAARLAVLQRIGRSAIRMLPALRRVAVRNASVLYESPRFVSSAINASLESSLRALRTDYVDFFLAHQASDAALPGSDVIDLLERLRRQGKIRAYGVATDFERLAPVLAQRPELSRVIQFDSEPVSSNAGKYSGRTDPLVITYGFIGRSITACRELLQRAPDHPLHGLDEDRLGTLLVRASVLANPQGIVLMQSRSPDRVARNVRAACTARDDEDVRRVVQFLGSQR
jgi:D-threo-aldose 1-dehydrogenase